VVLRLLLRRLHLLLLRVWGFAAASGQSEVLLLEEGPCPACSVAAAAAGPCLV
jgi:hypothetical protein